MGSRETAYTPFFEAGTVRYGLPLLTLVSVKCRSVICKHTRLRMVRHRIPSLRSMTTQMAQCGSARQTASLATTETSGAFLHLVMGCPATTSQACLQIRRTLCGSEPYRALLCCDRVISKSLSLCLRLCGKRSSELLETTSGICGSRPRITYYPSNARDCCQPQRMNPTFECTDSRMVSSANKA